MCKICLMAVAFCGICGGIYLSLQNQVKAEKTNDLLFENVEALADGESNGVCYSSGSVVCPYTNVTVLSIKYRSLLRK